MHLSNNRLVLLVMVFILFVSLAVAQYGGSIWPLNQVYGLSFGSKVLPSDPDESKVLNRFYVDPDFAFYDGNTKGLFEPNDPVYIHISPTDSVVNVNDVRLTPFGNFPAGSQVGITDPDVGYPLSHFGTKGYPGAEVRYFDVNGNKTYSLDSSVYLDFNPGTVTSGDIRLTNSSPMFYGAGTRVKDSEIDSGKRTELLPGVLEFYNANGNTKNDASAAYDSGDLIYMATQSPFLEVTINDIRLSS